MLHTSQMLYLVRVGEFLPNRLTAPLLSTLCTAWPLDEVCTAAVSYFFFGPSSTIRPQDYKGEGTRLVFVLSQCIKMWQPC